MDIALWMTYEGETDEMLAYVLASLVYIQVATSSTYFDVSDEECHSQVWSVRTAYRLRLPTEVT